MAKDFDQDAVDAAGQAYYGAGGAGEGTFAADRQGAIDSGGVIMMPTGDGGQIEARPLSGGMIHYGPEGSGITLPIGTSYQDSLQRAQSGYGGDLSLGGPVSGIGSGQNPNEGQPLEQQPFPVNPPTGGGGGGGQPPPTGGNDPFQGGGGSNKGWNWDAFSPQGQGDNAWGGSDPSYGAFERYKPGEDSPWGMPGTEGGNNEFYQQQFANLLRDDQNYRGRAREAQEIANRPQAQDPFSQPGAYETMWEKMGITPNQAVERTGDGELQDWSLRQGLTTDSTNRQVIDLLRSQELLDQDQYRLFDDHERALDAQQRREWNQEAGRKESDVFAPDQLASDAWANNTNWAQYQTPQDLIGRMNQWGPEAGAGWRDVNATVYENMFSRNDLTTPVGGGPSTPAGYAKVV